MINDQIYFLTTLSAFKNALLSNIIQNHIMIRVLILNIFCVFFACSTFISYMPMCLLSRIQKPINYTLSNFGHILYGRKIVGEIIIPEDEQFCTPSNSPYFLNKMNDDIKKFVLLKRGKCKFTKKILNAQRRGADMVIVFDNTTTSPYNVIMANDGHGHLIDIPSIFISNEDGQKIKKTFVECGNSSIFKIDFEVYIQKTASVTFWLDATNRESFVTIRDFFRDYYNVIQNHIKLDVQYKVDKSCGRTKCQTDNCILDKSKYCHHGKRLSGNRGTINGKQIVAEHLRESYLFHKMRQQNKITNWVYYMQTFDENNCVETLDLQECSLNLMKNHVSTEDINSFILETLENARLGVNNTLERYVEEIHKHDILFFPEVSINNRNFYGLFRAPDIFEMICQSLLDPPKECHSFIKNNRQQTFGASAESGLWKKIFIIICILLSTFLIILFIYTRLIKKQMDQQMSVEVNKLVEQYVAMTDEKSRSSL